MINERLLKTLNSFTSIAVNVKMKFELKNVKIKTEELNYN